MHANKQANEVPREVRQTKNRKAQQKVHGKEPNWDDEDTKAEQKPKPKQKPKTPTVPQNDIRAKKTNKKHQRNHQRNHS